MESLLLLGRLVLAGVLLVAGIAKLLDLDGSRRAVQGFGVPKALAAPLGVALPVAEIAIAVALIPRATAWWGAIAAATLLGAFVIAIAVNLARGRTPDCHCFGQLHSEPVGRGTLLRNGLLLAIALGVVGFGASDPGTSATAWFVDLTPFERTIALVVGVQAVAIAALGWLALNVLAQNGRLLQRMDELEQAGGRRETPSSQGLPLGVPAPDFTLDDTAGHRVSLDDLRAPGKPILAIFTNPGCAPCAELLPDVARWQRANGDHADIAIIASGSAADNREKVVAHGFERVLLDATGAVFRSFAVSRTPAAVVVAPNGTIASPQLNGTEEIRRRLAEFSRPPLPAVGDPAPDVALPDLHGEMVATADYRGRRLALLFWNPACGFCQRMTPSLQQWLADRQAEHPEIVLVSTGSVDANRRMEIDAPMLLDDDFATGRTYGARGTPSVVLIDAEGAVASPVTVGATAIMELLAPPAAPPHDERAPVGGGAPAGSNGGTWV